MKVDLDYLLPPDWRKYKKQAIDMMAAEHPALWRRCYPRIYDEPSGQYTSLRELGCELLATALKIEQGHCGSNEVQEIVWASQLARYRVPVFWLTPDMAEAIKQTTPPHRLNTAEMKLPFEAGVFMMPKGTILHETDEGEAVYVSWLRVRLDDAIPSLARCKPTNWKMANVGTLSIFAHTENDHLLHWTLPDQEQVKLDELDKLITLFEEHKEYRHTSDLPFFSDSLTPEDNRFMAKVTHFVLGTLILMTARPDLITTGALRKKVQKKNEPPKEFWSPNIIGEHFKLRREHVPQGGTHASPRGHWVRGFYRDQSHGPQHSLRKEIWIEPFWRGGAE
jgi:hypothetical protein